MNLALARVTLKQHRFEIAVATIAALAVGVWALFVDYRLDALNVPAECIDGWLAKVETGDADPACSDLMRRWGEILTEQGEIFIGEGVLPLSVMGILPFAVGLLGGVPIVARELESHTTQTAWSLNPSRLSWLMRQVLPIAIILGAATAFAATAASVLEANREAWGGWGPYDLGLHGPLVVFRAFAAFGLGLMLGALLGRALPAFVLGGLLSLAIVVGVGVAREMWLANLDAVVIGGASETGEVYTDPGATITAWAWRAPDGQLISDDEALNLVPSDVQAQDDPEQPTDSTGWLQENGYELIALGLTDAMALGWEPYDASFFTLAGLAAIGGTVTLVNRRRPN